MQARPDVLNHNTETVPRLYRAVRPAANYENSLNLIAAARELDPAVATKSGMMLGLGEQMEEVLATMRDLVEHRCQILTLGQYLRPSLDHLPIARYVTPSEFAALKAAGEQMGFAHVESGPLVRSSYHARTQLAAAEQ
jgi:lipoic acid synthetase